MLMSPLQRFMLADKYARYNPINGRRETWEEVTNRVVDFFVSSVPSLRQRPSTIFQLQQGMLRMEALPSMRVVQMAGPALQRCNVGAYNCLAGDERFVTYDGLKTFAETVGTTQTVLCADGAWRPAAVSQFGEEAVNVITFRPGTRSRTALRKVVKATPSHGWVTTRGHVRDLRVGDEVIANSQAVEFDAEQWVRGFLFGDGTVQDGCARVRLCGQKAKYLPIFEQTDCRVSYPSSNEGDPTVSWSKGTFADAKALPAQPHPYWMQGYFSADGGHQDQQPTICTTRQDTVVYLQDHAAELGIVVTGLTVTTSPSNYGERQPLYKLGVRAAPEVVWRVLSIEPTDEVVPVYCVTEPVTHTFTLAGGLTSLNCAFLPLRDFRAFGELLYILMQGTGVGFSCEAKEVEQLPALAPQLTGHIVADIPDTTEGWCDSVVYLLEHYSQGMDVTFDYSQIRKRGARLKTKGGRASGPEPLKNLHRMIKTHIDARRAEGFLRPIDAHDIACACGQIVEMGGVRRSALISLSDIRDSEMRNAKTGAFWETEPQRAQANNSFVITQPSDVLEFEAEWAALASSGTGERGIFNRLSLQQGGLPKRRQFRDDMGVNPCGEIILRPFQFCNLSIAVAREGDTESDLLHKVELAAIWGTLQATLTSFTYLRPEWKANCEEERLLGVDITGQMDCAILRPGATNRGYVLRALSAVARKTNEHACKWVGITPATAVTCVKPSGNSAQLLNCSSGLHARWAPYYIRRVRVSADSPISKYMFEQGVSCFPEVGQELTTATTLVFEFPVASPKGAVTKQDFSAIQQLENWLSWKLHYTEHNPSCTIYVKPEEWDAVGQWVQRNIHLIGGLSFLPDDGGVYELAPYQEITEEEFFKRAAAFPSLDFTSIRETEDNTTVGREMACTAGACEL